MKGHAMYIIYKDTKKVDLDKDFGIWEVSDDLEYQRLIYYSVEGFMHDDRNTCLVTEDGEYGYGDSEYVPLDLANDRKFNEDFRFTEVMTTKEVEELTFLNEI